MSFFGKIGAFFAPKNEGLKLPAQQITSTDVPINAEAAKKSLVEWIDCWQEYRLRDLAFNTCVNLIAKAIANCEFKTYQNGEAVKKDYYYMLNVEPNINENSTAFWQKVIYRLYKDNEALILSTPRGGMPNLVVADSWMKPAYLPAQENIYRQIQVGDEAYTRELKESEVIHLVLNSADAKAVVDALYGSYHKLLEVSMKSFGRENGQRMKVHVDQVSSGQDDFEKVFAEMVNNNIKPFLQNDFGILPEFNGYHYEMMDGTGKSGDTRDIRALVDDIFSFTARGFGIPPVLVMGDVAGIKDVATHWLTTCIDPLASQISEELNRKMYGRRVWQKGDRVSVDTSTIQHFDILSNAANVEKIVGSAVWSPNDILEMCGQEPLPYDWANTHWMTKNIATVESIAKNAASTTA